jgi:hypothetical protein
MPHITIKLIDNFSITIKGIKWKELIKLERLTENLFIAEKFLKKMLLLSRITEF